MKKIFALASVALLLTSCAISNNTANTANFKSGIYTATVADLEVMPERVTYTYNTTKKVRRAGAENVRHAAEQELLATKAPGYDMILEPTYVVEKTNFLFRSRIDRVTVSGRPAKYKNPARSTTAFGATRTSAETSRTRSTEVPFPVLRASFVVSSARRNNTANGQHAVHAQDFVRRDARPPCCGISRT